MSPNPERVIFPVRESKQGFREMEKDRRGGLTKRIGAYMRWKDERIPLESDPYEEGLGYCPGLR